MKQQTEWWFVRAGLVYLEARIGRAGGGKGGGGVVDKSEKGGELGDDDDGLWLINAETALRMHCDEW